ncbi:uncharacterized protein BJX67DRAFT_365821 [Aspergillus lucknowensis]|uniref:Azaphilone pigments biosynthesis cluster protein L N-terminal domain-containing protein n=1 Tax=Aspergillus lucknowensis TaxID=176173 RepID=A0ABR4LDT9_9EURO
MGDPLSVASGVVALSGFALQASRSLYRTIEGFRNSKRAARELREEVQALSQTLETLEHVAGEYEVELSALKLPLLRCGAACKELSDRIEQCVKHSAGSRTSLRDWTRLQYLGEDIANYKNVLANYKATIDIALGGATFRTVAVTRQVLQEYKDMIQMTTSDLHDRLNEIEGKLSISQSRDDPGATISPEELQKIEDEKQSTAHCLDVCKQVSNYIEQYQSKYENRTGGADGTHDTTSQTSPNPSRAQQIAQSYLKSCIQNMSAASNRLQDHLNQLEANLRSNKNPTVPDQVAGDFQKIKEERETIAQCLNICADASSISESSRVNVFEDVASLDDTQQVLVSTIGDLLHAKRVSTGARSLQVLGQMSDETLQHLNSRHNGSRDDLIVDVEQREGKDFRDRYGTGRSLQYENPARKPGNPRSTP